jgi:predicted transcriptional regulator
MDSGSALLKKLPARELEVARAVYHGGSLTANQVIESLSNSMCNSAVRTTLRRLEAKKVIKRRREWGRFVYFASSSEPEFRKKALAWVASEHYGGSLRKMIDEALELVDELSAADASERPILPPS